MRSVLSVLQVDYPHARIDQTFAEIGMDSLDYLSFLVAVEEKLGVQLPPAPVFHGPAEMQRHIDGIPG